MQLEAPHKNDLSSPLTYNVWAPSHLGLNNMFHFLARLCRNDMYNLEYAVSSVSGIKTRKKQVIFLNLNFLLEVIKWSKKQRDYCNAFVHGLKLWFYNLYAYLPHHLLPIHLLVILSRKLMCVAIKVLPTKFYFHCLSPFYIFSFHSFFNHLKIEINP